MPEPFDRTPLTDLTDTTPTDTTASGAFDRTRIVIRHATARGVPAMRRAAITSIRRSRDFIDVVTLKKFRDTVDSSMTDVVIVMSAQAAEIDRLRDRVDCLEKEN
jgi:hypothetical protein